MKGLYKRGLLLAAALLLVAWRGVAGGLVLPPEDGALPVLELTTDSGELPGDAAATGALRLETAGAIVETPVTLRLRGNTSRRFPKKGYRLSLTDAHGNKRKLALCGLRRDDDWILNPLYADSSKVREALGCWLWSEINSQGQRAAGSALAYVEVVLNGEYWGLYALQERVDRKQVDADRRQGVLYKVRTNDRPAAGDLLDAGDAQSCGGFRLTFAGEAVADPWLPAADYMALLEGTPGTGFTTLSRENAVDYALWSMLTQARDNHFKNMYIHAVPEAGGYRLYRIPWDMNYTLGDLWTEAEETNHVEYAPGDLALDDVLPLLLADGDFTAALRARWAELRAGAITEENLLSLARTLHGRLYPAILRDTRRWPDCGMGEGSAANIRDIEDFVEATLMKLDRWTDGLE